MFEPQGGTQDRMEVLGLFHVFFMFCVFFVVLKCLFHGVFMVFTRWMDLFVCFFCCLIDVFFEVVFGCFNVCVFLFQVD